MQYFVPLMANPIFKYMNDILLYPQLATNYLAHAFQHTTASYKFYWFLSIIKLYAEEHETCFYTTDVFIRMVAKAWAPLQYYHLSFGKMDSLKKIISEILKHKRLRDDSSEEEIVNALQGWEETPKITKLLGENVPFRFLQPWLRSSSNTVIAKLSVNFANDCFYSLTKDSKGWIVQLNPLWCEYIRENQSILKDFAQWHLSRFIQGNNPTVPFITSKLTLPKRSQFSKDTKLFWDNYRQSIDNPTCLITHQSIEKNFTVSHFLPWSLLPKEVNWNLMITNGDLELKKGNRLLNFNKYVDAFCHEQQMALRINLNAGMSDSSPVIDNYKLLGSSPAEMATMSHAKFRCAMCRTLVPMNQIALNMGYKEWCV